jgi:ATP:ADP antiporter, AAA family
MTAIIQRVTNVRRDEVAPVLAAGFYFFCILTALMVLRPARDALGMQRGIEAVRWLFIGTALVTLLVNPVFGLLVSRFRRLTFITATYALLRGEPPGLLRPPRACPRCRGGHRGQVFYVWFSVFNLFVTMVFWGLMVDRFSLEQSKRIFGVIAVGGTLGAIFGPWLTGRLTR